MHTIITTFFITTHFLSLSHTQVTLELQNAVSQSNTDMLFPILNAGKTPPCTDRQNPNPNRCVSLSCPPVLS